MSMLATLHLAISAAVFIAVFIEGSDQPAFMRIFTATLMALLWLPLLIIFLAFVAGGWVSAKLKGHRR
ncbi:MAG: hypothetical protein WC692_07420 [Erythrobacter sp.]|jgi:heme A synthase